MSEVSSIQKGHPKGLYTLFFSEMWERFCYYGMRVLLILYLTKSLIKGDAEASLIYGAYTGLVYAAPVLGGKMADKFLGYRLAIIFGAILMAIGEFMILGGNDQFLLAGMGALIIGNGYFKANISTIVGKLYEDGDPRRDSGFTIFYVGINIGAFLATSVVAYVGETYGFKYGFGLAGIGMLLGTIIFWTGRNNYKAAAGLDVREEGKKKIVGPLNMVHLIMIGSILLIPVCYALILNNSVLDYIFLGLFVLVAYNLISAGIKEGTIWRDRMIALVIFILINVMFWACFEQAGTSLTLFADRNVDREIFGWIMPASMTQVFNPLFIIIFGSIFSVMWVKLSKMGRNPSIPMKFAYGILQLGLGFLVTLLGFQLSEEFMVPLFTLVLLYLLHTTGELFLSPIGLSMVTKLAPKKITGTAMGAWFLSFAIANFVGGKIAALTGEGHGGEEKEKTEFNDDTTVRDAAEKVSTANFEEWVELSDDTPKNISLGKFVGILDFVEFRQAYDVNASYADWSANRSSNTAIETPEAWLDKAMWEALAADYQAILDADKAAEEAEQDPGIDESEWAYFKGGFEAGEGSLQDSYAAHKRVKLEEGLNKYTDIFSLIGYILIGFALLLMLLSRPLNKLMHGVT